MRYFRSQKPQQYVPSREIFVSGRAKRIVSTYHFHFHHFTCSPAACAGSRSLHLYVFAVVVELSFTCCCHFPVIRARSFLFSCAIILSEVFETFSVRTSCASILLRVAKKNSRRTTTLSNATRPQKLSSDAFNISISGVYVHRSHPLCFDSQPDVNVRYDGNAQRPIQSSRERTKGESNGGD